MCDFVQATLGLEDITPLDETVLVKQQINLGVIDLLSRTRCTVRCVDIHTLAGVNEYTLDHAILSLVDINDGLRRVPRDSTWSPSFTLIRSDILRIQPTPDVNGELQVWAVKRPQPMSADNDSPGAESFGAIPDEYQDAIISYALWKCADYSDDATSQMGERYRVNYEGQDGRGGRLGQIKIMVNKRGTSRAPTRRVRGLRPVHSASNWAG